MNVIFWEKAYWGRNRSSVQKAAKSRICYSIIHSENKEYKIQTTVIANLEDYQKCSQSECSTLSITPTYLQWTTITRAITVLLKRFCKQLPMPIYNNDATPSTYKEIIMTCKTTRIPKKDKKILMGLYFLQLFKYSVMHFVSYFYSFRIMHQQSYYCKVRIFTSFVVVF